MPVSPVNTTLSSYFTNIITQLMEIERQPLVRLNQQRDTVNIQRSLYTEIKLKIDDLKRTAQSLLSSSAFNEIKVGRNISITPGLSGKSVATATTSSAASVGIYDLSVTTLAKSNRFQSTEAINQTSPLNKSGFLWIGGENSPAASASTTNSIETISASAIELPETVAELGSGSYTIETQVFEGVRKFRLKDSSGNAVSIADRNKSDGSMTTDWQVVPSGGNPTQREYSTGRGLNIVFRETIEGEITSDEISYTARGRKITVESSDSLVSIAQKINNARQPAGGEINASVVGKQLILSGVNTGKNISFLDETSGSGGNLGFSQLQAAQTASFAVNGIAFSTTSNTNLNQVIYGVSLNLESDAEGQTARLSVNKDVTAAKNAIKDFLDKFNSLQSYINIKSAITDLGNGNYSRGPLASDTVFLDLRQNLFTHFMARTSSGTYRSLSEIGIGVNTSDLGVSITNSAKLEAALMNNTDDVVTLLDNIIGRIDTSLARFTGSSGYIQQTLGNMDNNIKDLGRDITDMEARMASRESSLTSQYAAMQAQLMSLSYQQSMWSSIYGRFNSYS